LSFSSRVSESFQNAIGAGLVPALDFVHHCHTGFEARLADSGGGHPVHALESPPPLPHAFAGTVSILEPAKPAEEGILVELSLDGERVGVTTVDD